MTAQAFWLLAGFLCAHFTGDFSPLVTSRMLEAKADGGPLLHIAAHAAVHGLLVTVVAALVVGLGAKTLALAFGLVFVTHFLLDAGRAQLGQRFHVLNDPGQSPFWHALGIDQLAHALVLLGLVALIVS
jgi:hypothetical protein